MTRSMEGLLLKIELVPQNRKQKKYIKLQSKKKMIQFMNMEIDPKMRLEH